MFENFESFDLALFPMIRSLEHEFSRNFFEPFQDSENYKNTGAPIQLSGSDPIKKQIRTL